MVRLQLTASAATLQQLQRNCERSGDTFRQPALPIRPQCRSITSVGTSGASYLPRKHTEINGHFRHCSNSNAAATACGDTASRLQVFLILKFAQLYTITQRFTIKHCTCSESYVVHVLHAYQQICSNAQVMMGMLCCADHAIFTCDTTAACANSAQQNFRN
jgi:hypothetical protein